MAEPIRLAASNDVEEQRLPRNVEAEAAFLGALLIDNRIVEDVSIKLRPDHFFEPLHGRIFEQDLETARPQHAGNASNAEAAV